VANDKLLREKMPVLGPLIGQLFLWFDRQLARNSDEIVLIYEDFQLLLASWHIAQDKMHVIPNWAPLPEMPVRPMDNEWAVSQQMAASFNFLYAGTLGMKHNPDLLLQLAKKFQSLAEEVRVVVVSEGLGADWLQAQQAEQGVANLILLPYQPYACLPDVLGSAAVLLAILEADAGVFSVPSKVLSYLCAQRPLLLAVPLENLAARVVLQNKAGFAVAPTDVTAFVAQALALYEDPELRATLAGNGRAYAEQNFDIEKIAQQFEKIMQ
jgi:glycosyltransferase involved in cell wall biosynthesis